LHVQSILKLAHCAQGFRGRRGIGAIYCVKQRFQAGSQPNQAGAAVTC